MLHPQSLMRIQPDRPWCPQLCKALEEAVDEIADGDCFATWSNSSYGHQFSLTMLSSVAWCGTRLQVHAGLRFGGTGAGCVAKRPAHTLIFSGGSLPCPGPQSAKQLWLSGCQPGMLHTCCSRESEQPGRGCLSWAEQGACVVAACTLRCRDTPGLQDEACQHWY